MKKILIIVTLFLLSFSSMNVDAKTITERKQQMEEALADYKFDVKYVNMEDYYKLIKEHRTEEVWNIEGWFLRNIIRSELEKILDFEANDAIDMSCHKKGDVYEEYVEGSADLVTKIHENDECEFQIYLDGGKEIIDKVVSGKFTEVEGDANTKKEAYKIIESIVDDVYVADLSMLNHYLNYSSNTSTFFAGDNALNEFASLKKVVEDNPSYEFFVGYEDTRRGDAFVSMAEGSTYIRKDGIIYGFTLNTYTSAQMFFVPVGTKLEDYAKTLEDRLKEYVNDEKIKIEVKPYVEGQESFIGYPNADVGYLLRDYLNMDIQKYYQTINSTPEKERAKITEDYFREDYFNKDIVAMHTHYLYINDIKYEIGIAELDINELDKIATIVSKDYKTGIILKTKSGNVPLDAKLLVEQFEVTKDEARQLKKLGYKNIHSYNLKLYSKILDKIISEFNNVTDILIPYNEEWGKNLKVLYMSENLKDIEYFDVEVVEYNNQKYLQFSTKHFSNYYIVEDVKQDVSNPPTGDNILKYLLLILLSCGLMLSTKKYQRLER